MTKNKKILHRHGNSGETYAPNTHIQVLVRLCILQKGCTRLAVASDKFTSCLPMVGGSLRVLQLLPPLKLVAMI